MCVAKKKLKIWKNYEVKPKFLVPLKFYILKIQFKHLKDEIIS